MSDRVPTELADILTALEVVVATDLSLAQNSVFTTLSADEEIVKVSPSDMFVTFSPYTAEIDQGLAAGAGKEWLGTDANIKVCLWIQLALDQAGRDSVWLKETSLGALRYLKRLMLVLQLYDPVNGSGDKVFEEPMRCLRWRNLPRINKPASWGRLESEWQLRFFQPLNVAEAFQLDNYDFLHMG